MKNRLSALGLVCISCPLTVLLLTALFFTPCSADTSKRKKFIFCPDVISESKNFVSCPPDASEHKIPSPFLENRVLMLLNNSEAFEECLEKDPSAVDFAVSFEGKEALHLASGRGEVRIVEKLLILGADPQARFNGSVPMHLATKFGHLEVVKLLRQYGARVDQQDRDGYTPLHLAADSVQVEMMAYLLKQGADPRASTPQRRTPLHAVAANRSSHGQDSQRHIAAARLLLAHGADINAAQKSWFAKHGTGPLTYAVFNENTRLVHFLLEQGADVHQGQALITAARKSDHAEIVRLLVEYGADVNGRDRGATVLDVAVLSCSRLQQDDSQSRSGTDCLKTVSILLNAGADANAVGSKHTVSPLWIAVKEHSDPELVRLLLSTGANADVRSANQRTPLFVALEQYRTNKSAWFKKEKVLETIRLLLAHGANPNARNDRGRSLLYYTVEHDLPELATILLEAGAEQDDETAAIAANKPEMRDLLRKYGRD